MGESATGGDLHSFWAALADRYVLERQLGAGGMAVVFLARDLRHDRPVAIKVLRSDLLEIAHGDRFAREIRIVARFAHPHILSVYDSGEAAGRPYFVMPFVEGESLRARLEREKRFPVREAVRLAREVADALSYAHAHGVVHRDIKPENILLESGHAVVADFGIARVVTGGDGRVTTAGLTLGTPAYMSPEQITGEGAVDGRTDIYSLGCVLFEMLTGRSPFGGKSVQQMMAGHVTQVPTRVVELRPDAPPALDAVVARALGKARDERFETGAELAEALDAAMAGEAPARPGARSRRTRAIAIAAGGAVAVAGLAFALGRFGPSIVGGAGVETLDQNLLAVAPFQSFDERMAVWQEGLMDILSRNFDGAGPIRTVSPTVIARQWQGRSDAASAATLGKATGAGLVVYGLLRASGADSVMVETYVYDVPRDSTVSEIRVKAQAERMDLVTDSLTVRVLGALARTHHITATTTAGRSSLGARSLPALKAFLQGEQFYRRNDFAAARPHYEHAIDLDSTFALALRRMRGVLRGAGFSEFDSLSFAYALRAGQANHGLTARDSLLVVADSLAGMMALATGFVDDAYVARLRRRHATLQRAAELYPRDPEVWSELGEVRTHFGDRVGISQEQALDAFERAIALDSAYGPAYYHTVELSLTHRSVDTTLRYLRGYLNVNPKDGRFQVLAGVLERVGEPPSVTDEWLRAQPASARLFVARMLARWPDSAATAVRMLRELEARPAGLTDQEITSAHHFLTRALLFRGRAREAASRVDEVFARLYAHRIVQMALFRAIAPDSARRIFGRWLDGADMSRVVLTLPWWSLDGDTAAMRRVLHRSDSVSRAPATTREQRLDALYGVTAARGRIALASGDTTGALQRFRELPDSLLALPRYFERYDRARLLSALRRDQEAARVLDLYLPAEYTTTVSEVIWWLERARVATRLGDRERAVRGYTLVSRAWANADVPELQASAREAEAALRAPVVAIRPTLRGTARLLASRFRVPHIRPPDDPAAARAPREARGLPGQGG